MLKDYTHNHSFDSMGAKIMKFRSAPSYDWLLNYLLHNTRSTTQE